MQPIISGFALEGNVKQRYYHNSTEWINIAQRIVAKDLDANFHLDYYNQWRLQTTWNHQFEHAKPQINPEKDAHSGTYNVTSYSHNNWLWDQDDKHDTPLYGKTPDYWTAIEVGAKLRSREAMYAYFNVSFSGVKEATCKEINE